MNSFLTDFLRLQQSKARKKPFLIVSLDGGGVRGALQCALLGRLFERLPWLEERVDMYAGSSVGAFLAAGLATRPFSEASACCTQAQFRQVFTDSWQRDAHSADGWYEARYASQPVAQVCDNLFGATTLSQTKKHLLLTAQRVDSRSEPRDDALDPLCDRLFPACRWQPVVYHTLDSNNRAQLDTPIGECLRESSAAPTYFAAHNGCVDGGLLANNPCMLATAYAKRFGAVESLDNVFVLSLGTGKAAETLDVYGPDADLGKMQWIGKATDLAMQANAEAATLECASLLGDKRFFRLQPLLKSAVRLDDVDQVPLLEQLAQEIDLSNAIVFLEQLQPVNE